MKNVSNGNITPAYYNRNGRKPEVVTDLLIDIKRGQHANGFKVSPVKQNGHNVECDARSQSLPDCSDDKIKLNGTNTNCGCNTPDKLDNDSPTSESWFRTWPERYDKQRGSDSSSDDSMTKTNNLDNTHGNNCDTSNVKNKFTLNEALQNISLAYSPVTKQLHLVQPNQTNGFDNTDAGEDVGKKLGHRRTEAGSFSSTVSTLSGLSEQSPSGSLLDADERSLSSLDVYELKSRKKSLTNFFSRNVFSWKSTDSSSVWKLFSKSSNDASSTSPLHVVASSSALIQHGRPSNLPAKTEEEEQRHKEEYKAMVVAAKKREAQTLAAKQKQQKIQLQQEEQQAASTKHFMNKVLPNWDGMKNTKKTQDLWWQGLPSSVRGKVWRLAIGNELNLTPQLYEICLSRAQTRLNSPEPSHESDIDQESSMNVIQLDISRTFPHLCIFQEGGPYSDVLHSLLAAYVCYRPDVGYVQGMSYIAAILILNMDQLDAFICFANLLNQPLHLSAFTLNQNQMQAYYQAYNQVFCYNLPKLYAHFEAAGLTPDLYLLDWIYTVYAKAMPLDVACRIWDVFLRDGYEFIFRTALGILHLNQDILITMDFLHGAQFLTRLPDDLSSDQLFKSIQLVTTSIGKQCFSQIVYKCSFSILDKFS